MKVFVYGTLKRGGVLHNNLTAFDSKYLGVDKINGYKMYEMGWFPAVKKVDDPRQFIYGEVYEIEFATFNKLDMVEGDLFRKELCNTAYGQAYIYILNENYSYDKNNMVELNNYTLIHNGFFPIEGKKWNLKIGDDEYKGDASKIVFDMRFFDTSAGRCETNKQYMNLYKERTFDLDINTSSESIFLTDLLIQCNLREV